MKKLFIFLLAAMLAFCLSACDTEDTVAPSDSTAPALTNGGGEDIAESNSDDSAFDGGDEAENYEWPDNEYTRLIPTPTVGGKALTAGRMVGTLFTFDMDWTMEHGETYAAQLAEAGFGEDRAEKFKAYGCIDRTANGVNVQLLELGGKVTISIMRME